MHKFILVILLVSTAAGAEIRRVVNDHMGNPMVEIIIPDKVFPCFITCEVRFMARNISGLTISHVWVDTTQKWRSGHQDTYSLGPARVLERQGRFTPDQDMLAPGESTELVGSFIRRRYADAHDAIQSIDLQMSYTFESPQEQERTQRFNEDVAKAERDLKARCVVVYRRTIDKAAKDLTVREEMDVAYCRQNGWYRAE
jgi:hypothetical protein